MRHADTLDKIVGTYLASVCADSFRYKGRQFAPKALIVSPLLLRGYTCPANCGACCGSFSLDYTCDEARRGNEVPRTIAINGRSVTILSDMQRDVQDAWCRHLDRETGRCLQHASRPMACDFELIRFLIYDDRVLMLQKTYGRAWAMMRLSGNRGALCEMLPENSHRVSEVIRKLQRLEAWAMHLGVRTRIPKILEWIAQGNTSKALRLPA